MKIIALQGLMGGTGNTSMVAGLAFALNHLKENVFVMDFCPTNFLGLQFNMPTNHSNGWAPALLNDKAIETAAMRYVKGIDFLPFGEVKHPQQLGIALKNKPNSFTGFFNHLQEQDRYQWLILDVPHQDAYFKIIKQELINNHIVTLNPNSNCHVRLSKSASNIKHHYLINQFNPSQMLEHDLQLLWSATMDNLLPLTIHQDASVSEAQALKMPVNMAHPDSMASKDLTALAHWLMDYDHTGIAT